jgi:4-amino-4-deoxy-L-arabinose transferase-like glycosyltransferase
MRLVHWFIVAGVHLALTLPYLGTPSLWDMDEGVNAECTREMLESGTWIVPTYNWQLRTAKPVLTYWIQRPFYIWFGCSEWSARVPSALLGLGTVLLIYELARRMFDPLTGLLSGVVLASTVQFCLLSHAATPDASLIFFTVLALYLFWVGHIDHSRLWWIPTAAATAMAVLSKGPIGVGFPGLIILIYFILNREWRRLLDWRIIPAFWTFLFIAAPWYILVTSETRGEWAGKFLGNENLNRFTTPQENHSGPFYYYLLAMLVMSAPWSSVIGLSLWNTARQVWANTASSEQMRAHRFLLIWVMSYLILFSIAATKLPNYIAPLYPALAIITARFLIQWMRQEQHWARVWLYIGSAAVAFTGVAIGAGLLIASGSWPIELKGMRLFPGLENWAWIGAIPVLAAPVMIWGITQNQREKVVLALAICAVLVVGFAATGPVLVVDQYKSAKQLVQQAKLFQPEKDIRIATLNYSSDNQSLVFYAQRKVETFHTVEQAIDFLTMPQESYLLLPVDVWQKHFAEDLRFQVIARKYDFYRNTEILVLTSRYMK